MLFVGPLSYFLFCLLSFLARAFIITCIYWNAIQFRKITEAFDYECASTSCFYAPLCFSKGISSQFKSIL